jgi:hypothetical protein
MYNTIAKELKEASNSFPKFYFEFATVEVLLEREDKDTQH